MMSDRIQAKPSVRQNILLVNLVPIGALVRPSFSSGGPDGHRNLTGIVPTELHSVNIPHSTV